MRMLFLVAALLGTASHASRANADLAGPLGEVGPRYVTLGVDALDAARGVAAQHAAPLELVEIDGDVAVVALDARDLGRLAEEVHRRLDRCGGFMVHDSLADAHAAATIAATVARPGLDYTLDRPAVVRGVLPAIERARIRDTILALSAMPNRYFQSPTGAAASEWLRARWRGFTTRDDVTVELYDQGYAQKSVILTIPGTTRADEVIVIGGHLD